MLICRKEGFNKVKVTWHTGYWIHLPIHPPQTHAVRELQCHAVKTTWQKRTRLKEGKTRRRQTVNNTKPSLVRIILGNKPYITLFSANRPLRRRKPASSLMWHFPFWRIHLCSFYRRLSDRVWIRVLPAATVVSVFIASSSKMCRNF